MGNFLKRMLLGSTLITHDNLLGCGFNADNLFYELTGTDLKIYLKEGYYFYYNEHGKPVNIKSMWDVSKLIYGQTEYLRNA